MAVRLKNPVIQHIDIGTDKPLSGGQLFFFEPGTDTPKATFKDAGETLTNINPVRLDDDGFEPSIFGTGSYRIILRSSISSGSVEQWTRDPVDFEQRLQFSAWLNSVSYSVNDIVLGFDGNFYVSIQNNNTGNNPGTSNPEFWTQWDLLKRWNPNETYSIGDPVRGADGILYNSVASSNIGIDPVTNVSGTPWKMFDNIRIDGNSILSTNFNGNLSFNPDGNGLLLTNGLSIKLSRQTQQIVTASTTITITAPTKFIRVEVIGGGGGGGGSDNSGDSGGGGGGSGAYIQIIEAVSTGDTKMIIIGNGGAGGVIAGNGGNGGDTQYNGSLTAGGGLSGPSGVGQAAGGAGGVPVGTGLMIPGESGGHSSMLTPAGGAGGGSHLRAGAPRISGGNSAGISGPAFGCGGSGAINTTDVGAVGGAGASGVVIITFYA